MTTQPALNTVPPPIQNQGKSAEAFASSNIALCKYWGKKDRDLNIPLNPSLSISLDKLGTRATIQISNKDSLVINGTYINSASPVFQRVFVWVDKVLTATRPRLSINTFNNFPMAAGLASSASAFAAMTIAMSRLFDWQLPKQRLSIIARAGSGSAARSIFSGFVALYSGKQSDGSDSYAEKIPVTWPEFCISIIQLSSSEKSTSSRDGMNHTVDTSILFNAWPEFATSSFKSMLDAIYIRDFTTLGELAEHNAITMHATMMAAKPPLIYWLPETLETLQRVQQLRKNGIEIYATMDAGANVKIIYLQKDIPAIKSCFTNLEVIQPFRSS